MVVHKGSGLMLHFRPMANSYMPSGNWSFELFEVWYGSSSYFLINPKISLNLVNPQIKSTKLNPQISGNPQNLWISLKSAGNTQIYLKSSEILRLISFFMSVAISLAASIELFNCLRF